MVTTQPTQATRPPRHPAPHAAAARLAGLLAAPLACVLLGGCGADGPAPVDRPAELRRALDAGEGRDATQLPWLVEQLDHDDPAMRMLAAQLPWLVEQLDHDDPAMRMLAAQALKRLTGQTLGYDPYAPREERRPALDRWRDYARSSASPNQTSKPSPALP